MKTPSPPWRQQGQASLEYALMIAVVVLLVLSVFKKVQNFMVGTGTCPAKTLLCMVTGAYQGESYFSGTYRRFDLRRYR